MIRKLSDRELNKHFGAREDHEYRHYNRSLGCFVEGKEHFKKLLARGNFIPYDLAQKYAAEHDKTHPHKDYTLSKKARDIIASVKLTADRKGNIKLGGRAIEALKEIGAIPSESVQKQLEAIYREGNMGKGGFGKENESFSVPVNSK